MKYTQLLSCFIFLCIMTVSFTSCEKKETIVPDDPFEFVGTWNFRQVDTSAPLLGSQTDNEPTGSIIFMEDGTGTADYSFNAVAIQSEGIPISRDDSFNWTKNGATLTMNKADGNIITWTIVKESDNDFQATWSEEVAGVASIDFHAFMAK